ncbi:hypothetical protein EXIGLDRAFT_743858 [Exidia glandulosa HHB12029]|uniref:Fork-head domain-containing protein n=1 Tax=Exidia glandulosa HHB12029 TaxID=1314781 RepID=A0A165R2K5_EXIGL|nr:hypothetical protein EXIGLDRAFT_743858 [Exidia glandulosa HHB12029]
MATTLLESPLEPAGFGDGPASLPAVSTREQSLQADAEMPPVLEPGPPDAVAPTPDENGSIAAYYSLVFPNFTYYLQTLDVTIGRRLANAGTSADGAKSVDVDLGPLKSVSRLHAKITYDDEDERWVLDVYGRNGAWVDGNWSGPGSRVALESRTQIQIASRTFCFVLPPTEPPDDSPLTSSPTSTTRPRSPSLDATSLSPASSPASIASPTPPDPEHTAEPEIVEPAKPRLVRKRAASDSDHDVGVAPAPPSEPKSLPTPTPSDLQPEPESTPTPPAPAKTTKPVASTSKPKPKPKAVAAPAKPAPARPSEPATEPASSPPASAATPAAPPKAAPYVRLPGQPEPQKPAATLSQLCYRAIKALDGRATLQGILGWIMETYEWYRMHSGEKWESSVRHNLSSNAAFVKSRRNSNEPGKGAFWCIDPAHIESFEATEMRLNAGPPAKAGKGKTGGGKVFATGPTAPPPTTKVKKEQIPHPPMPMLVPVQMPPGFIPPGFHPHPPPPAAKSVKPPPPPLMSTKPLASPFTTKPLATKPIASPFTKRPLQLKTAVPSPQAARPPVVHPPAQPSVKQEAVSVAIPPSAPPPSAPPPSAASTSTEPALHVPIVVGPLPASYPLPEGAEPPPIALHEGRLILSPKAFSHLTPEEIKDFEKLGSQGALAALQVHVVKFLKEQMRLRGRGRGRGRGAPGRGGAGGRGAAPKSAPPAPSADVVMADASPDVTMHDVMRGAAETPEESTAPRSQSQVRPRSNSAEVADVPPAKRPRVESASTAAATT